jgi:hypothetical protein
MLPAPRQKPAQISPILKADTVRLHVSREKDGKLRLGYAGMGRYEVVQPDGYGQARRGGKLAPIPPAGGAMTPLCPLRSPPWFFQVCVPLTCIEPCIFRPRFEVALRVTAPLRYA